MRLTECSNDSFGIGPKFVLFNFQVGVQFGPCRQFIGGGGCVRGIEDRADI